MIFLFFVAHISHGFPNLPLIRRLVFPNVIWFAQGILRNFATLMVAFVSKRIVLFEMLHLTFGVGRNVGVKYRRECIERLLHCPPNKKVMKVKNKLHRLLEAACHKQDVR